MQIIYLHDLAWKTTFPRRIAPCQDEWFPGFLSRCDEINRWESGTTLSDLRKSTNKNLLLGKPYWIIVPPVILALLAERLVVPMRALLATTYNAELARLYDTPSPHTKHLSSSFVFRFCPCCIAEARLLRRIWALPNITCCPCHQVDLVKTCACSSSVQLFSQNALPFSCPRCGLGWADWPRHRAKKERLTLERKFLSYYEFFFVEGTPVILAKALQLVRESVKRKKEVSVTDPDGNTKYVECYDEKRVSLGYLIMLLASLNISCDDIMAYKGPIPWWSLKSRPVQEVAPDTTDLTQEED